MSTRIVVLVAAGLAAGCQDDTTSTVVDMAPVDPTVAWTSGPGMPMGMARDSMPIVLAPTENALVGWGGDPLSSSMPLAFSLHDDSWSSLVLGMTPPAGRAGHCAVMLPQQDRVLYVGGHDASGPATPIATMLTVGAPTFTPVVSSGPAANDGCAAAYLPTQAAAYVFGGGSGSSLTSATSRFDPAQGVFSQVTTSSSPSPRTGAAMALDPGPAAYPQNAHLLLFGGTDANGENDELWIFDGADWNLLATTQDPNASDTADPRPLGRANAAMAVDPARRLLYLFGGLREGVTLNDLWRLDLDGLVWNQLTLTPAPTARQLASVAYDTVLDRLMLFGGRDDSGPLADGWQLAPVK